jgi:hypothetical protein
MRCALFVILIFYIGIPDDSGKSREISGDLATILYVYLYHSW